MAAQARGWPARLVGFVFLCPKRISKTRRDVCPDQSSIEICRGSGSARFGSLPARWRPDAKCIQHRICLTVCARRFRDRRMPHSSSPHHASLFQKTARWGRRAAILIFRNRRKIQRYPLPSFDKPKLCARRNSSLLAETRADWRAPVRSRQAQRIFQLDRQQAGNLTDWDQRAIIE
jgi:hypothetical protein